MITDPALVMQAIQLLQRLSDIFCERREQLAREVGLTVQQWRILEQISDEHFMPSLFARQQESTQAAVSKIIRQLLDKGVVVVKVSDVDGRQREYALTESGHRMVTQLRASRERAVEAVWGEIDAAAIRNFLSFGEELLQRLKDYSKEVTTVPAVPSIVDASCITELVKPVIAESLAQPLKAQKASAQIHDIF